MPLVRITTRESFDKDQRARISDAIQAAIHTVLKAPADDRFQIFSEAATGLVYDKNYLQAGRSDDTIFIQVFLKKGRTPDVKKQFYATVCASLAALGVRRQDVFICLFENDAIDWSFGNGEAQIA